MTQERTNQYQRYMDRCIELALQGREDPRLHRPYVGAIVFSASGEFVGEGYRSCLDGGSKLIMHAERRALDEVEERARGGTLITTLEPCVVPGSRSTIFRPCGELIANSGIRRVVIGLKDNSPVVNNNAGIINLQRRGIEVVVYEGKAD